MVARIVLIASVAVLLLAPAVVAQIPPLNDLLALGKGEGQQPEKATVQNPEAPPVVSAPRAVCEPGSKPEPGVQGRVPAGAAADGLWCNMTLVSRHGTSGGFKVLRYVDRAGRECAYYDTALLFPLNALNLNGKGLGVVVLDMSDPAKPRQTALLTEVPMLSPHESLSLSSERGLLAAVSGNPATAPGVVALYDVSQDCRKPVLQFTKPLARFGHESGFTEDGKTFYATGTATESITAIDVSVAKDPHVLWHGAIISHGMTLSRDGNRAYVADPTGKSLLIMDTSEIQARKPDPKVREISRLTWTPASIPQNAIPFTSGGRPYVLEFDEYNAATLGSGSADEVGAARIIDIGDETRPRVIANLRLEVNQPAEHAAAAGDPGASNPVQGYAAHYCNLPTRVDPKLVACSFIASGLRLFDISTLTAPKEVAYYVAPTKAKAENLGQASSFAMSQPTFVPERREVWYSDGTGGFYALRVSQSVWPVATQPTTTPPRPCVSRRNFTVRVRVPRNARVRSIRATLDGKVVRGAKRSGRYVRVPVNLRGRGSGRATLRVTVKLRGRKAVTTKRVYRTCGSATAQPTR
ncbi:hypothetical protein OJ998_36010 [Solirubrobacter taibaiensis]|nr:hypothetical protein [Solirubrobacter taibaiensis]